MDVAAVFARMMGLPIIGLHVWSSRATVSVWPFISNAHFSNSSLRMLNRETSGSKIQRGGKVVDVKMQLRPKARYDASCMATLPV